MSQNINLYTPAFRKERSALSLNTLAACTVVTVLAFAALATYLKHEVDGMTQELGSAEGLLKAQRSYSEKLKGESASRKGNVQLESEVARLENELKQARESMDALKGGAIGTQEGFAEYLRAFSRQSLSGLWLTGLTVAGGEIEIRGRALSPELVPGYIQRLGREKALAGRSFARLEMTRPRAPEPDKGKDERGKDKEARKAPRYLEFSLATSEAKAEKAQ